MSSNLVLGFSELNLKMGNPSTQKIYEFGDFRLHVEHRMLYRGDNELPLAPKAIETLLALVERRGEIVTKDELINAVWPDVAVEESNLFAYLSVLRKTLGEQRDGRPWVETLRRRGYRFNGEVRVATHLANGRKAIAPEERRQVHSISPAIVSDGGTAGDSKESVSRSRRTVFAIVGMILVIAAMAIAAWYVMGERQINSVAVMPFVNESGDADLDYLSVAMTESLIGKLSNEPGLQVKSSTSVARYKGNTVDSRTIGQELNTEALLYGRVAQRGDDVTVWVELVDAQTENRLWNRSYTRKLSNLILLEGEVSRDLVDRLKAKLLGSSEQQITKNRPENGEAYQQFLLGRYFYRKLTREAIEKGISHFDKAIELDPSYALAYAAKGEAYRALALAGEMPSAETLGKAREWARRALEINPDLAEGHVGLATITYLYDWNFDAAENEFLRALELDPESSMAHFTYGDFLGRKGEGEKSLAHIKRARELEPASPFFNAFEAFKYPDKNEALRRMNEVIDFAPDFYLAHSFAGAIYRMQQMYPESIAAYRRAKQLSPDQTWSDVGLAGVLVDAGQIEEARTILNDMLRKSQSQYVPAINIASIYDALGEKEDALRWLDKAYEQRDPGMTLFKSEAPRWKSLNEDPRFQDLLRRMGT